MTIQEFSSINIEVYISAAWMSLNTWVLKDPGTEWNIGIMDNSPVSRTGDPEYMTFNLKNIDANGNLGYFTPGHANCLLGWQEGLDIKLYFVYENETHYKYRGKIMPGGILTTPGIYGARIVRVHCHGFMSQAADHDFALPSLVTNVDIGDAITAMLANLPIQPLATEIESGGDVFPTAFDTVRRTTTWLGEAQKFAMSEQSYIYTKGDRTGGQTLVIETRSTRSGASNLQIPISASLAGFIRQADNTGYVLQSNSIDKLILNLAEESNFSGMALGSMRPPSRGIYLANEIKAGTTPRKVDVAATTVLFATQERILLKAGETKNGIRGSYRDPSGGASYVSGKEMINPPISGTDYTMFANANGTGTNLTANLFVTPVYGTEAVEYSIINSGGTDGYVYLQARGKGIYIYDKVWVIKEDETSQLLHGKKSLTYDMPYQNDPAKGDSFAEYVLSQNKDPQLTIKDYPMFANRDTASILGFLYAEPGKRSHFTESMNAIDGNYFIMGYRAKIVAGRWVIWSPVLQSVGTAFAKWDESVWNGAGWGFPE